MSAACGNESAGTLEGYAEAEYIYISARDAGEITTLAVEEGAQVNAGDILFSLDAVRQQAAMNRAQETITEARSAAQLAAQTYNRTSTLRKQRQVAQAQLDQAAATLDAAAAHQREAEAALVMAQQDLSDRTVKAPAAGRIEQVIHRPGERVAPTAPVLALLPPANIKVRFFLPEPMLSRVKLGDAVTVTCDACKESIAAKVSFIATEPQFTPPFIYSRDERDKLVFLVEARPADPKGLRPGQPLDVSLAQ